MIIDVLYLDATVDSRSRIGHTAEHFATQESFQVPNNSIPWGSIGISPSLMSSASGINIMTAIQKMASLTDEYSLTLTKTCQMELIPSLAQLMLHSIVNNSYASLCGICDCFMNTFPTQSSFFTFMGQNGGIFAPVGGC